MTVRAVFDEYIALLASKGATAVLHLRGPAKEDEVESASREMGGLPSDLGEIWRAHGGMKPVKYAPHRLIFPGYWLVSPNEAIHGRSDPAWHDSIWGEQLALSEELRSHGPLVPVFDWDSLAIMLPLNGPPGSELILLDSFQIPFEGGIVGTGLSVEGLIRLHIQEIENGRVEVGTDGGLRVNREVPSIPGIDGRFTG